MIQCIFVTHKQFLIKSDQNLLSILLLFISAETKDEPWAWEAREYLRKRLIGEEVWFTAEKPEKATREYGTIYLGKGM